MPGPDPDDPPTITVPASATAPTGPVEPVDPPPGRNGSHALGDLPARPPVPEPEPLRSEDPVVDRPPTSTSPAPASAPPAPMPERTAPVTAGPAPVSPPPPNRVRAAGSRWMIIHPHVSFFGWLADQQGPVGATPEERLDRYRRDSPWLFRTCVVLDLLVLFVVTTILVVALGAALFKTIFGVL